MSRVQAKGVPEVTGGIEAAAIKLMGGVKPQIGGKVGKAAGAACHDLADVKCVSRKPGKAFKATSGLKY